MSKSSPVHACLIVDDPPANATYWARLQQQAMGFEPRINGNWGANWTNLASAPLFRLGDVQAFADIIEEFGVRGKFTFLPCPAGLGRIDRSIRGYTSAALTDMIAVIRDRIMPQMNITPECLTHSMAYDPDTEALLPHAESFWLTHLCLTGQTAALHQYLRHAWQILANVGLTAHGLTVGGMTDVSGIGAGKSLLLGDGREVLGQAILAVEAEFKPAQTRSSAPQTPAHQSFLYTGAAPISAASRDRCCPEAIFTGPRNEQVFELHSMGEDPLLPVLHGPAAQTATLDAMIAPDLAAGSFIQQIEAGRLLVFTVHCQTLMALNSGAGLTILREALRRLRERYGRDLHWHTAAELCAQFGAPQQPPVVTG
ncbi:MAG TPA: hypothetical protein VL860_12555 [Planctomycetota bacterium]|nr:hypothetical protein [Planctomycetota bacterium]